MWKQWERRTIVTCRSSGSARTLAPCSVRDFIDLPPSFAGCFVLVWRLANVANHRHNHNYIRSDNRRYNTANLHAYSRLCPLCHHEGGAAQLQYELTSRSTRPRTAQLVRRLLHLRAHISLCSRSLPGCGPSIKQKRATTAQNPLVASSMRCWNRAYHDLHALCGRPKKRSEILNRKSEGWLPIDDRRRLMQPDKRMPMSIWVQTWIGKYPPLEKPNILQPVVPTN